MFRWSKIPEEHRPEIISDVSDDKFYTFIVQDWNYKKIKRKAAAKPARVAPWPAAALAAAAAPAAARAPDAAWEGHYWHDSQAFKNIIDKNIPCTLMHKVKNKWCPEIDIIVCFMTGDTLDVFLVHPKDLMEWDPDDQA